MGLKTSWDLPRRSAAQAGPHPSFPPPPPRGSALPAPQPGRGPGPPVHPGYGAAPPRPGRSGPPRAHGSRRAAHPPPRGLRERKAVRRAHQLLYRGLRPIAASRGVTFAQLIGCPPRVHQGGPPFSLEQRTSRLQNARRKPRAARQQKARLQKARLCARPPPGGRRTAQPYPSHPQPPRGDPLCFWFFTSSRARNNRNTHVRMTVKILLA